VGFIAALWLFSQPIKQMGVGYANLLNAGVAADRVRVVLEHDGDAEPAGSGLPECQRIEKVVLRNASFGHAGKVVIGGVNLTMVPSRIYAIIGPNGSGKSTILSALAGFSQPLSGDILINGESFGRYDLSSIRERISMVPQEILLFSRTIRENIVFGQEMEPEGKGEIYRRAMAMSLAERSLADRGCDDLGLISEKGQNFSGGEKQRLCIARALFKEHDVLLLDEADSHINKEAFASIMGALHDHRHGRIIIMVTHDPECLRYADEVLTIRDGTLRGETPV